MINKHEHIYYEPLVDSIRMGKNILRTREHRLNHISSYVYLAPHAAAVSYLCQRHWGVP